MRVLRGYFHRRCAQSWAAKVLPKGPLPGRRQGGASAPLARETREPGLLQRPGARGAGAGMAGGGGRGVGGPPPAKEGGGSRSPPPATTSNTPTLYTPPPPS